MKFTKLLSLAVIPLILSGCTNNIVVTNQTEQTEISFSWWGNDARHDYTLEAIKKFEELHPEIKVKCHYSEWSGYQSRNNVQMVSHTESDVMQINYAWINQYSHDGNGFYDINQLSDYINLSTFTEDDLSYGMQNGKLNAIPIALNTMTVYINESVYSEYGLEIPKTFDDLYKAAEVMNGKNYPLSMAKKQLWFFVIAYVEQMNDKKFMDNDGNILFDKSDIQLMIETYCNLVNKKVIPQVEYFDKSEVATGKYAGILAWLSDANSYCEGAEKNGYNIVVADYTTIDGNLTSWYAKPATMYAIRKDIEHPKEAGILLDYLLNSTEMASYQQIEKGIPISSSARNYLEKNELLSGIQYDAFIKMSDTKDKLDVISPFFENEDMIEEYMAVCNEVLYEKAEIEQQAEILLETLKSK